MPGDLDASFVLVGSDASARTQPPSPVKPVRQPVKASGSIEFTPTLRDIPRVHPSLDDQYSPGSARSYAHDWSNVSTGGGIRIHGRHFVDEYGRVCGLRGVNLSGACKTPANHDDNTFPENPESVTFVGRPFPLDQAHEHFSRLRRWGLTFIRFLVTWEAIEHAGPGIYDKEYLAYVRELLSLLPRYGMTAFISVHQDVWSRYSGGSGAPAWTLDAVGLDIDALEETGAAWLGGMKGGGHVPDEVGLWPTGYHKLAASTMATCFWGGDMFAPKLLVDDQHGEKVPIQHFLQNCFLKSYEQLARAVGDLPGVCGFQMMNEPHPGYIRLQSLHSFDYNINLHLGPIPSAFQSFQLGAGHPTEVPVWTRSFPMPTKSTRREVLNKNGRKAWKENGPTGGKCLWEVHGVWGWDLKKDEGVVLRETYFRKHPVTGDEISWYEDCYFPLLKKWSDMVRSIVPKGKAEFVEAIPNEFCPTSWTKEHRLPNMVYAPHWYDLKALFERAFGEVTVNVQALARGTFLPKTLYWGQQGARDNYSLQIRNIVEGGYRSLGETPVVIGEIGIPMDMNRGEAFKSENFVFQSRMMDALMTALERSLVCFTLWNYNPHNSDSGGDHWNGENFSWFSGRRALPPSLLYYDQMAISLDNGGRILRSVVRPYAAKTAGIPLRFEYEPNTGSIVYEWSNPEEGTLAAELGDVDSNVTISKPPLNGHPKLLSRETEIFLPSLIALSREIIVKGLGPEDSYHYDEYRQTLFVVSKDTKPGKVHKMEVSLNPPLSHLFEINTFWSDHESKLMSALLMGGALVIFAFIVFLSPNPPGVRPL
ncbi:glycoside hydrolase [Pluteus cervinus]|uniref:Glycoside hydrolase n=1 Tax=Pluteus cervinus TaxID=181527 RepID=A0ACD3AVV2_9AGAR|nr:glycoside hydrolase [Pluteus cervinus]